MQRNHDAPPSRSRPRSRGHGVRARYPNAKRLTITADGGGSNGSRVRLWKRELQRLANQLEIEITVHYLPLQTERLIPDGAEG